MTMSGRELHNQPYVKVLNTDQIEQIHLATLAVLERTGIQVTHAGDESERLFVVEQGGQIRIIQNGIVLRKRRGVSKVSSLLLSLTQLRDWLT